ncbi:MAG: ATP-dependent protease ATPase subunit HslU [Candidatus Dormibacteraeota bacterium]|nr:ATP-dependent protease ATPase subunit HslU [Candidatus Dormibacteraeota bacterium]MBV9524771.1 ATP-dependent protease ATPase subunit HslU [Candidatus Dormibacteraeota bacterium]
MGEPQDPAAVAAVSDTPAPPTVTAALNGSSNGVAPAEPQPADVVQEVEREELRPVDVVRRLDEYIIGQDDAKKSVAIALRNRVRRLRLPDEMRQEVLPKNILMIGPTGVGKTEIARRVARLTASPFIKVEATKFTEVGYVGRDVESIVRDLLEQTITEVHNDRMAEVEPRAKEQANARILETLLEAEERAQRQPSEEAAAPQDADDAAAKRRRRTRRNRLRRRLASGVLDERLIDIEVEEPFQPAFEGFAGTGLEEVGVSLSDFFSQMAPARKRQKRMSVADARTVLMQEETDRLIDMDRVYDDAIRIVEDDGIVFIDEVDKITGRATDHGPDVSGEGVQRDLLPILEGSTVHTRYGPVRTDHILFVAAGAFNVARPSDLIPEFQGRFPIRVELQALSERDLERILTEPGNALTKQYTALLGTEGVELHFAADGIAELARHAHSVNEEDENIGARRLFTLVEKVLEDVSYRAEDFTGQTVVIDAGYVSTRLADLVRNQDVRRFVL